MRGTYFVVLVHYCSSELMFIMGHIDMEIAPGVPGTVGMGLWVPNLPEGTSERLFFYVVLFL